MNALAQVRAPRSMPRAIAGDDDDARAGGGRTTRVVATVDDGG